MVIKNYDWPNTDPLSLSWFQSNVNFSFRTAITSLNPIVTFHSVEANTNTGDHCQIKFKIDFDAAVETVSSTNEHVNVNLITHNIYTNIENQLVQYVNLINKSDEFILNISESPPSSSSTDNETENPTSSDLTKRNKGYVNQNPDTRKTKIVTATG